MNLGVLQKAEPGGHWLAKQWQVQLLARVSLPLIRWMSKGYPMEMVRAAPGGGDATLQCQ
jgi:hypothetical protein